MLDINQYTKSQIFRIRRTITDMLVIKVTALETNVNICKYVSIVVNMPCMCGISGTVPSLVGRTGEIGNSDSDSSSNKQ